MDIFTTVERLGRRSALNPPADVLSGVGRVVLRPRGVRAALQGRPVRHPLHPMLVQLPVGAWTCAGVLDAVPGTERAADILIGVGLLAAPAAAATGLADWSELDRPRARIGAVHALGNVVAVGLFAGSLALRRTGRRGAGRLLSYLGLGVVSAAGMIGGHLNAVTVPPAARDGAARTQAPG
ncbi:MAG TPA: DUF2231 domain-containing protein [Pilimelia sp.]|nr:DUF2231 domain-containing protein [Pilimelia sp.]